MSTAVCLACSSEGCAACNRTGSVTVHNSPACDPGPCVCDMPVRPSLDLFPPVAPSAAFAVPTMFDLPPGGAE